MTFDLPESHQEIQRTVREFCEREVKPHARRWDDEERFPVEVVRKIGELGFMGMTVPEEYGGAGLDPLAVAVVVEEVARYDGSLALRWTIPLGEDSGKVA